MPGQILPEETIVLHPAGEAIGRLISVEGEPVANSKLRANVTYGNGTHQFVDMATDSTGGFRIKIPAASLDLEGMLVQPNPPTRSAVPDFNVLLDRPWTWPIFSWKTSTDPRNPSDTGKVFLYRDDSCVVPNVDQNIACLNIRQTELNEEGYPRTGPV